MKTVSVRESKYVGVEEIGIESLYNLSVGNPNVVVYCKPNDILDCSYEGFLSVKEFISRENVKFYLNRFKLGSFRCENISIYYDLLKGLINDNIVDVYVFEDYEEFLNKFNSLYEYR